MLVTLSVFIMSSYSIPIDGLHIFTIYHRVDDFYLLLYGVDCVFFFFFQAEDGIRDLIVTGVQTCALPISQSGNVVQGFHEPLAPARVAHESPEQHSRTALPATRRRLLCFSGRARMFERQLENVGRFHERAVRKRAHGGY